MPEQVAVVGVYLGAVGALAPINTRLVDFWGLVNPVGARFDFPVIKPGHSKPLSNVWLVADYADPTTPPDPAGNFALPQPATAEQVAAARRALACGELADIQKSTREPMSLGRFWENFTGALGRTFVMIPPDPFEAERKFCK